MEDLYTGFVWTGNKLGAGTDARVSCWLEDVNKKNCGAPFIFRQKEGKILQKVCSTSLPTDFSSTSGRLPYGFRSLISILMLFKGFNERNNIPWRP